VQLKVDLNSDLGESFGAYKIGDDERIIPLVTSVNVACGFHAGDPSVIRRTVELAARSGAAVGAHPGFPDLQGFGRRTMHMSEDEVYDITVYQIGALKAFADACGIRLQHVKPHGALYNMASADIALARAIARAVYDVDSDLILLALSGSRLLDAGREIGLKVASEVFADRAYEPDGSLRSRKHPDALIHDPMKAAGQAVTMLTEKTVVAIDGTRVPVEADSICFHGDGSNAVQLIQTIRGELQKRGIAIVPLRELGKPEWKS